MQLACQSRRTPRQDNLNNLASNLLLSLNQLTHLLLFHLLTSPSFPIDLHRLLKLFSLPTSLLMLINLQQLIKLPSLPISLLIIINLHQLCRLDHLHISLLLLIRFLRRFKLVCQPTSTLLINIHRPRRLFHLHTSLLVLLNHPRLQFRQHQSQLNPHYHCCSRSQH